MMHKPLNCAAILVAASISMAALAAPSDAEIKRLGNDLLPWGAEKAGNAAGTIAPYTGQVPVPAAYDPKKPGVRPDPFAAEKPLYSVTAENMAQHAEKISDALQVMLKKYPKFRMDVYRPHRTMVYPDWYMRNSVRNASSCKEVEEGGYIYIEGCYGGIPFPLPQTGREAMWNHVVKYSAPQSWESRTQSWMVDSSGRVTLQGDQIAAMRSPFFVEGNEKPNPVGTEFWNWRHITSAPARKSGEGLLMIESSKMGPGGTRVHQYIPGQRRVKLSPDFAYDTPNAQSGGSSTLDDARAFAGALDRFDFKLVGKKEMLIPYNNFMMHAGGTCTNEKMLTPGHLNPDCVRWELHRVWVVEATVKKGFRHIYPRRVFYWDEDAPAAGMSVGYDAAGQPYRLNLVYPIPMYEAAAQSSDAFTTYDLQTGAYIKQLNAPESGGWYLVPVKPNSYFTPDALGAAGVR